MRSIPVRPPDGCLVADSLILPPPAGVGVRSKLAVIAFGIRVEGEGFDLPDLSLPWGQDAVIDAVASANPNTIVVLETGNPVSFPKIPSELGVASRRRIIA